MKKTDMDLEFQKGTRVDVVVLDDGELPADILDQFPTTPYRDPKQVRIAQQQA